MKRCENCSGTNPGDARYCMQCGHILQAGAELLKHEPESGGLSLFALSIAGSVVVSLVLVFVFHLPVFFLAGFLPLFWFNRKKG